MSVLEFPSDGSLVLPAGAELLQSPDVRATEPTNAEIALAENSGIKPWLLDEQNAETALSALTAKGTMPYDRLLHQTVKEIGGLVLWTAQDAEGYWAADGLSKPETQLLKTAIKCAPDRDEQFPELPEPPKHKSFGLAQKTEAGLGTLLSAGGGALTYFSGAAVNFLQMGVTGVVLGGLLGGASVAHTAYENYRYKRDDLPVIEEERRELSANIAEYGATLASITKKVMDASVFVPSAPVHLSLKHIRKSKNAALRAYEDVMREELEAIDEHYKDAKEKNGGYDDNFGKFADAVNGGDYDDTNIFEFMGDMYAAIKTDARRKKDRKDAFEFNPLGALYDMVQSVPKAAGSVQLAAIWNDPKDGGMGMKTHLATIGRLYQELTTAEEKWHMLRCADNGGLGMKNDQQAEKIAERLLQAKQEELEVAALDFIAFRQRTMRKLAAGILDMTPGALWTQPPSNK